LDPGGDTIERMDDTSGSKRRGGQRSKIIRVIGKYDLEGLADEMVAAWTGEGEEKRSLRQLATEFNQRVLEASMREAGRNAYDENVSNLYRLLTDGEVSSGVRTETRERLRQDGVDIDEVEEDFVSHQAVHTYLTKHRNVTPSAHDQSIESRRESALKTVLRLQSRSVAVIRNTLDWLIAADAIELKEYDIVTETTVICKECGISKPIDDLIDDGGCYCQS
jgi:hypothetical protein